MRLSDITRILGAILVRPNLWVTSLRQLGRLAPSGWWKSVPFLPVPPVDYLEFRLVTQYGGGHGAIRPTLTSVDVVDYLVWCKQWNSSR